MSSQLDSVLPPVEPQNTEPEARTVPHGAKRIVQRNKMIPTTYRPARKCDRRGCEVIVRAAMVIKRHRLAFCSTKCRAKYHKESHLAGHCRYCGSEIFDSRGRVGKRVYCSREHQILGIEDENFAPAGPFRSVIENYLGRALHYRGKTLTSVKVGLVSFFAYAHSVEGANTVNEITPSMVTRYIASERRRERSADNAIGFLSTFYRYLMAEDDSMMLRNPVISRLHYEKRPQRLPRPYTDEQLSGIRDLIEGSGRLELMLAAAIGEECGLRIGEVANIRVVDVDTLRQTIHVRLPTKNLEERDVPYHDRVALHMSRWLERRLPCGEDDHLLLSLRGRPYSNSTLCMQFHNLFLRQDSPAHGFSFHRLRHTWATKLMNNGLELSVLKLLGGWKDLTSMQRYIQVMPETIQRQYQEAFQKLSARPQERIAPVISLNEYARRRAA